MSDRVSAASAFSRMGFISGDMESSYRGVSCPDGCARGVEWLTYLREMRTHTKVQSPHKSCRGRLESRAHAVDVCCGLTLTRCVPGPDWED